MPSKESGFRNDATPEDDIEQVLIVSKGKRGFFSSQSQSAHSCG